MQNLKQINIRENCGNSRFNTLEVCRYRNTHLLTLTYFCDWNLRYKNNCTPSKCAILYHIPHCIFTFACDKKKSRSWKECARLRCVISYYTPNFLYLFFIAIIHGNKEIARPQDEYFQITNNICAISSLSGFKYATKKFYISRYTG